MRNDLENLGNRGDTGCPVLSPKTKEDLYIVRLNSRQDLNALLDICKLVIHRNGDAVPVAGKVPGTSLPVGIGHRRDCRCELCPPPAYTNWPANLGIPQGVWSLYCVFINPLRRLPGPLLAKVTPLWLVFQCRKARRSEAVFAQHKKYGDFVRIAPNHVSIANPSALGEIYGYHSGFTKGPFYEDKSPGSPSWMSG